MFVNGRIAIDGLSGRGNAIYPLKSADSTDGRRRVKIPDRQKGGYQQQSIVAAMRWPVALRVLGHPFYVLSPTTEPCGLGVQYPHPIYSNRILDVLYAVLAQGFIAYGELIFDLLSYAVPEMQIPPPSASPSITGRNINPIPVDALTILYNISKIDTDSKLHPTAFWKLIVLFL